MAVIQGIRACALVDSASGLVIQAAGQSTHSPSWEAAIDFWRLHFRLRAHFEQIEAFGSIGAIAIYHTGGALVIVPCPLQADLVVVCMGAGSGVSWGEWQQRVRAFDKRMVGF